MKSEAYRNDIIPTESFFIANGRIMAAIFGGQLTTDHNLGLSAFHAPLKDCPTLIQSVREVLVVDGVSVGPLDLDDGSGTVVSRGYADSCMAVRIRWLALGLAVEDLYFIPPDFDMVVQQIRIRNVSDEPREAKLFSILYPQLGSPVPHKKGICRDGIYDDEAGCVLIEDLKQNVLVFGFDRRSSEHQVGEVCGMTDVYYDLEDCQLSGNQKVSGVTPNAALALELGVLAPGETCVVNLCLGYASSLTAGRELYRQFLRQQDKLWDTHRQYWKAVLAKPGPPLKSGPAGFDSRLDDVVRQARAVLRSILRPDGAPLGGVVSYHTVGSIRNGCYILNVLDKLGYHDEVRGGYEFYLDYRIGDERFCSPDENDQLGTVLHVLRERLDLTGDLPLVEKHRDKILSIADRLVNLMNKRFGLIYSERAIHEFVAISRGYETYVNTMAWRGLCDASVMAEKLGLEAERRRYSDAAEQLRMNVLKHLVEKEKRIFVKRLYQGSPDATPAISMLTPALFGLIDASDGIVSRTIDYLMENIWDRRMGGLHRYPLRLQPWAEHPYGGPWVTYTSWLGIVHLLRDDREKAGACIRWVLDNVPRDSNLIPEHFSVRHTGRRGFCRIYLEPATPEIWATAEFLRLVMEYSK